MRIALLSEVFWPKIDGITNRLGHTLRCLGAGGHEVIVFAPEGAVASLHGARVVRVPGVPFPFYPGLRVTAADPRMLLALARFRPDVVHAVGPACLGVLGLLAARALRLPSVASYHTDLPAYAGAHGLALARPVLWPLLRRIHNLADLNLCPSSATRAELEARGVAPVSIWRGGVDAERFHPRNASPFMRARLSAGDPRAPIGLYVGRLSPEKGLEQLAYVADAFPRLRLAFVGDGPDRASLERLFRNRAAVFTGFLTGETLAAAYASANVFLMPSRTETLGFNVLEAMSSGCPVVAARAGGLTDLVRHGETGLLYDPDQPNDLVRCVERLLAQPSQAAFLAQQARKLALESSWERETRELVWSYRRAIERHARRSRLRGLARALLA